MAASQENGIRNPLLDNHVDEEMGAKSIKDEESHTLKEHDMFNHGQKCSSAKCCRWRCRIGRCLLLIFMCFALVSFVGWCFPHHMAMHRPCSTDNSFDIIIISLPNPLENGQTLAEEYETLYSGRQYEADSTPSYVSYYDVYGDDPFEISAYDYYYADEHYDVIDLTPGEEQWLIKEFIDREVLLSFFDFVK